MKLYTIRPGRIYQRGKFLEHSASEKATMIRDFNIVAVVNMTNRVDDDFRIYDWCRYFSLGQPDSGNVDWGTVELAVRRVVEMLKARPKKAVLVHCNGGRNRASLFSARLLMELEGLTGTQAIDELRRLRPNALSNPYFVKYLRQYR